MRIGILATFFVLVTGELTVSLSNARATAIEGLERGASRGGMRQEERHHIENLNGIFGRETTVKSTAHRTTELPQIPQVAFYKSGDNSTVVEERRSKGRRERKKGNGKRKRNPCKRKFKDFCIHGECQYLRHIKKVSCTCSSGYEGERCSTFILAVEHPKDPSDNMTTLAVVAVVLSSLSLAVILLLFAFRYHRRVASYDVKTEEKAKLENGNGL
uniref:Proheparin-binding EGF-like growth factor n=1 Tax=Callorhinchus milii TaxID=7868 RepID=V9LA55_CALMI